MHATFKQTFFGPSQSNLASFPAPLDRTTSAQALRSCPNLDDTDEGEFPGAVRPSSRLLRDQASLSPASSTPNLSKQTDPGILRLDYYPMNVFYIIYDDLHFGFVEITTSSTLYPVVHLILVSPHLGACSTSSV